MVTSEGITAVGEDPGLASTPASVLQQLSAGISLSADLGNLGQQQIYVVTDPSQLEALQVSGQSYGILKVSSITQPYSVSLSYSLL